MARLDSDAVYGERDYDLFDEGAPAPDYNNQVATLRLEPGHASVKVETAINSHRREPRLSTVFEQELTSEAPRTAA